MLFLTQTSPLCPCLLWVASQSHHWLNIWRRLKGPVSIDCRSLNMIQSSLSQFSTNEKMKLHFLKCQIKNNREVDTQLRVKSQRIPVIGEHHQWLNPSISRSTVRLRPLGPSSPASPFLSILCKETIKVNDTKSYTWEMDFINFKENIHILLLQKEQWLTRSRRWPIQGPPYFQFSTTCNHILKSTFAFHIFVIGSQQIRLIIW